MQIIRKTYFLRKAISLGFLSFFAFSIRERRSWPELGTGARRKCLESMLQLLKLCWPAVCSDFLSFWPKNFALECQEKAMKVPHKHNNKIQ